MKSIHLQVSESLYIQYFQMRIHWAKWQCNFVNVQSMTKFGWTTRKGSSSSDGVYPSSDSPHSFSAKITWSLKSNEEMNYAFKGFVYCLSQDSHIVIDRHVLLRAAGHIRPQWWFLEQHYLYHCCCWDWCIPNLAYGLWVLMRSIVVIIRGWNCSLSGPL